MKCFDKQQEPYVVPFLLAGECLFPRHETGATSTSTRLTLGEDAARSA